MDKFSELVKTITSMLFEMIKLLVRTWLMSIQICLPPLTTVVVWAENVRSFFFRFRNSLEILSGNFVQWRMDRSMTFINGSYWNFRLQLLSEWFRAIDSFALNKFDKSLIKSLESCSKFPRSRVNWILISIALSLTCSDLGLLTSHKNNVKQKRSSKVT